MVPIRVGLKSCGHCTGLASLCLQVDLKTRKAKVLALMLQSRYRALLVLSFGMAKHGSLLQYEDTRKMGQSWGGG